MGNAGHPSFLHRSPRHHDRPLHLHLNSPTESFLSQSSPIPLAVASTTQNVIQNARTSPQTSHVDPLPPRSRTNRRNLRRQLVRLRTPPNRPKCSSPPLRRNRHQLGEFPGHQQPLAERSGHLGRIKAHSRRNSSRFPCKSLITIANKIQS